jgi:hypothetical protein
MLRRGCLLLVLVGLLLCVLILGSSYFVFLPRAQDQLAAEVEDAISTQTARVVQQVPSLEPGTIVLTEESFSNSFINAFSETSTVTITPERVTFEASVDQSNRSIRYSGVPAAENGRFVLRDFDTTSEISNLVLPADKLRRAIEAGVNEVLAGQGLRVVDLQLGEGQITLITG